jgi:hypothetical protein
MRQVLIILMLCLGSIPVDAALLVPAGLAPGSSYQLAFVTSANTTATSGTINDYNTFVQGLADAAGIGVSVGVTWTAIASTATVDANTNAVVSAPVFNLGAQQVATGYADFWDGSHTVGVGIDFEEGGTSRNTNVWTGSNTDGTRAVGFVLGGGSAVWGESTLSSGAWINRGTQGTSVSYALYALSSPLTVPIPIPAAAWLFLSAAGFLAPLMKRRAG